MEGYENNAYADWECAISLGKGLMPSGISGSWQCVATAHAPCAAGGLGAIGARAQRHKARRAVCVCVHVIKPTPLRPGTAAEPLRKRREGPWGMARG